MSSHMNINKEGQNNRNTSQHNVVHGKTSANYNLNNKHRIKLTHSPQSETSAEEPEAKKLKLDPEENNKSRKPDGKRVRGQNKSRPHMKPTTYDDKQLCLSVIQENKKCFYGEKCKFFHDVAEYMANKPADVGERCYIYDTFGKCQYSLSCRFAKAHTSPDLKNVVNEELVKAREGRTVVKNSLDKDLQNRLRKRSVSFKKSAEYLKTISKDNKEKTEQQGNGESRKLFTVLIIIQYLFFSAVNNFYSYFSQSSLASSFKMKLLTVFCMVVTMASVVIGFLLDKLQVSEEKQNLVKTVGPLTDADIVRLRPCEKKQVHLSCPSESEPRPFCGNLPFRRVCKRFGADITCGEMAMCTNLLQGQQSEWALLKRHETEDLFGVQVEGCFPDTMTRCAELINNNTEVDFVDINSGCPIDLVYKKGGGCGLMTRSRKFEQIVRGMNYVLDVPLTVKIRTGVQEKCSIAHKLIPEMKKWGVSMITLHGRSREQRYTKLADWDYINTCSKLASPIPLFGNGDILSYEDAMKARETGVSGIMIARGALIKPWIFTEIKERRDWDISSGERLDILRDFTNYGLEHWGSDTRGLEKTRNFLLEWLSFLCRYIPVGLLERVPQRINERPPYYMGRDYLESLMASQHVGDWVKISEMLLGPVPKNFNFLPKHKANAYK
uniref:tRNA-dihydrouridine(47) synthase [NAD(P)(+)] n=1 Tax=Myripristis murdjan TaxID=586833 RepID=A0A667WRW6_9TELE